MQGNKMFPTIYFSKKNSMYYNNSVMACDECGEKIDFEQIAVLYHLANRRENIIKTFCFFHSKKEYDLRLYPFQEILRVIIWPEIPRDSHLRLNWDVALSERNLSNFDLAMTNIDGEGVVDKTVHAGRESFEGATIGRDMTKELEKKDKPITRDEALTLFDSLAKAKPMIAQDEEQKKIT